MHNDDKKENKKNYLNIFLNQIKETNSGIQEFHKNMNEKILKEAKSLENARIEILKIRSFIDNLSKEFEFVFNIFNNDSAQINWTINFNKFPDQKRYSEFNIDSFYIENNQFRYVCSIKSNTVLDESFESNDLSDAIEFLVTRMGIFVGHEIKMNMSEEYFDKKKQND